MFKSLLLVSFFFTSLLNAETKTLSNVKVPEKAFLRCVVESLLPHLEPEYRFLAFKKASAEINTNTSIERIYLGFDVQDNKSKELISLKLYIDSLDQEKHWEISRDLIGQYYYYTSIIDRVTSLFKEENNEFVAYLDLWACDSKKP